MRWPLVWRSMLDSAEARAQDAAQAITHQMQQIRDLHGRAERAEMNLEEADTFADRLREEHVSGLIREQEKYAALLTKYHQLKLQGFAEPVAPPTMPVSTVDPVMQAVNEACAGKDAKVRRAMLAQVKRDRAIEMPDETIILRIRRGNRAEDEFTSTPSGGDSPS